MALKGYEEVVWNWQKRIIRPIEEIAEERAYLANVEAISHQDDFISAVNNSQFVPTTDKKDFLSSEKMNDSVNSNLPNNPSTSTADQSDKFGAFEFQSLNAANQGILDNDENHSQSSASLYKPE